MDEGICEVDRSSFDVAGQEFVGCLTKNCSRASLPATKMARLSLCLYPLGPTAATGCHGARYPTVMAASRLDVDPELQRAGANHGQQLAPNSMASMLRRCSGVTRPDRVRPAAPARVDLFQPVDGLLVDEFGAAAGLGEQMERTWERMSSLSSSAASLLELRLTFRCSSTRGGCQKTTLRHRQAPRRR